MSRKKRAERERRGIFRDYGLAIGGSILVALFIRFFVVEAYRMPSRAMQPAVEPGDTLFVAKRLLLKPPAYGDVVIFDFPDEPGREYIKRIVALPGDHVNFLKGGLVLNGKGMLAPNSPADLCTKESLPNAKAYDVCFEPPVYSIDKEVTVPAGQVYVVGDLRSAPFEGHRAKIGGLVPIERIKGRALFVWLSIQPSGPSGPGGDWFSRIRTDRLLKKIQ